MLDTALKDQLRSVFSALEHPVKLAYEPSFHEDQGQLVEMLDEVASTSDKVSVQLLAPEDGRQSKIPQFHIYYRDQLTGITFQGIPGGHEFSSLILAILNADSKGKLPDSALVERIKRLKGPIEVRTYVSLSCENCPDVVQALNQMALIHGNFHHTMVDGAYAQEEIKKLGIQGVPSVVGQDKLIHSGRIQLLDLMAQLEKFFGVSEGESVLVDANLGQFDVAVIGGGPAGAAAAIYSVRKGLKTALIAKKFGGQVQETKGIENLISVPYTEGPQLAAQLSQHVSAYPVVTFEHRQVKSIRSTPSADGQDHELENSQNKEKIIEMESGEYLSAQSVIVATGAKWRELGVPGEKEYLGRGVAFCPHCDGPFYQGKKVAVVGGGNSGVEAAIDLAGIVGEVVLFEYMDQLKADRILVDKLQSLANVSIVLNAKTQQILGDGRQVKGIEYLDRKTNKLERCDINGIFIQIGLVPNSQFLQGIVELSRFGEVVVDNKGRTTVPGIYAAGDVTTTPFKQIIIAMGEGAKAALASFEDRMYSQEPSRQAI